MRIGDWIITQQNYLYYRIDKLPRTAWMLPICLIGHIFLFIIFQITNLIAQLRWPFSAIVRLIGSLRPVPPGQPIPANERKLQELLQGNIPVLVDFWTEWCGPCVMMEGVIKDFAKKYQGKVIVAKVDATINPKLTKKYNVMGYPTLMLFIDG
jgi:thioredoxin 1